MAEMTNFAQLLEKLAAADSPSAQAALVAESAFAQLDPTVALVARCCIILRWFDPLIVAAFLPATNASENAFTADTVINQLAQLPFVERLPWGWTYHEQTRTGLLDRYATEQPDLLKQAALLAASAYQQHPNQALAGQEALFCWLVAGDSDKAQQQLDRLIDEAWGRNDWNGLLALFITSAQAAKLSFVQSLQYTAFHHYAQAVALRQLGNYAEAVAAYQQAIALDEKYASPWNGLGNAYRDQKRYDEAVAAFQQAIALDAQFAIAWSNLGLAYSDQKRYDEAVAAYQQAIALDAQFAHPWSNLGLAYRGQKRYDEAVAAYQQAIALDEKYASPWNG
ncbi:MAG: tetratricopeptide repeat protein, partial [Caldilineaceae bacterium]